MGQERGTEETIRTIKRKTRRQYSAEEKNSVSDYKLLKITINAICLMLMVGCAPSVVEPTPTPIAEAAITATGTGLPTNTLQPTTTPEPTSRPTITPYPIPEVPLSAEGPWLILAAGDEETGSGYMRKLWALNEDATGLTSLESEPLWGYRFWVHPINRNIIAYITGEEVYDFSLSPKLKIMEFPSRETTTITPLVDEAVLDTIDFKMLWGAIEGGGVAWSPDGRQLAFVAALHDETVDVYLYDLPSGDITRLADLSTFEQIYVAEDGFELIPDGNSHATNLSWSPDGRYVMFEDFTYLIMTNPVMWRSQWAVRPDDGEVLLVMSPDTGWGHPSHYGWLNSTQILLSQGEGEGYSIVAINLDTREITPLFEGPFNDAAYSEEHNIWFITSLRDDPFISFLWYPDGTKIEFPAYEFGWVEWSSEEEVFITFSSREDLYYDYTVTPAGKVLDPPEKSVAQWANGGIEPPFKVKSPDNTLWAWYPDRAPFTGLWIYAPGSEPREIYCSEINSHTSTHPIIRYLTWSPDSQRVILFTDRGIYTAERPSFEPLQLTDHRFGYYYSCCWATWIP